MRASRKAYSDDETRPYLFRHDLAEAQHARRRFYFRLQNSAFRYQDSLIFGLGAKRIIAAPAT
jgi:hypothetical protein